MTLSAKKRLGILKKAGRNPRQIGLICKKEGISRQTFYKWQKRFIDSQEGQKLASLTNKKKEVLPKETYARQATEEQVKTILKIVLAHPEYSTQKISAFLPLVNGKPWVGNHGVQNVLKRAQLSYYRQRLTYAQSQAQAPTVQPVTSWEGKVKTVFETFTPARAPAPPPTFLGLLKVFLLSFSSSLILTFLALFWIKIYNQAPAENKIGIIFASIALISGSFFFLFSLKYYLTLAIVLGFSRHVGGEDIRNQESGITHSISSGQGKQSWLMRMVLKLVGLSDGQGKGYVGGLQPNLEGVTLSRSPFVSIHLPMYNEKKVVNRLLSACTSMDYQNYEVIVIDDSNDETTSILQDWKNHPKVKLIHRESREGYKGGALEEAMKITNPQTEFVLVFDSDFVPYPDTITQFLKYFQSVCGNLDFQSKSSSSNIAAIQGYQWHVLNKSENWITRGVRSEYAGSYVVERSGAEVYGGLKQIAGSVYMIRMDVLRKFGWLTSITEDFQLTLRLYEQGYKVIYTPYIQGPAECVSTIKRLVRQRMRWAEGHSYNIKKMFKRLFFSPNLTHMEKLEFLYLSPYYLQAAFFLLGTFCWFLSEAVFKAKLPFWTALWGWSLVLTNMFSLPLLNTVGLFLEESEEKDYLGILSFIVLSYLLVPFQAYASVKGFIEKEEGPWFRTPKTGMVTDVLTRGRFYRWISGILPGFKTNERLASSSLASSSNPYLSLLTANNNFQNFKIKPKRLRWVGKTFLSFLLIFSTLLISIAPGVPYLTKPVQAQGFGLLTDQTAEESFKTELEKELPKIESPKTEQTKTQEEIKETLSEPIPQSTANPVKKVMKSPLPVIDLLPKTTKVNLKDQILGKINFLVSYYPDKVKIIFAEISRVKNRLMLAFNLQRLNSLWADSSQKKTKGLEEKEKAQKEWLTNLPVIPFGKKDKVELNFALKGKEVKDIKETEIKTRLLDYAGKQVEKKPEILASSEGTGTSEEIKVGITDLNNLRPGTYTLEIEAEANGKKVIQKQEFNWGVLALNPDKTVYKMGEEAYLSLGVLDNKGQIVCDAQVELTITSPQGEKTTKSTQDKSITVTDTCPVKDVFSQPDYFTRYQTKTAGTYQLTLKATHSRGTYTITDSFKVEETPAYSLKRTGPTRVFPVKNQPMKLELTPNEDFEGYITERLPKEFLLFPQDEGQVRVTEQANEIIWQKKVKKGETLTLNYQFKAPEKSPAFFLGGPANIGNWQEERQWMFAIDPTYMLLFWDGGAAPTGWQIITTYDGKFVRGDSTKGGTGGNATHSETSSSVTTSDSSAGKTQASGATAVASYSHNHGSASVSIGTGNNLPLYRSLKLIQNNDGIPATIPSGGIGLFDDSPGLPGSGWTRQSAQDTYMIYVNSSVATGGNDTHSHSLTWTFPTSGTPSSTTTTGTASANDSATSTHTHDTEPSQTSMELVALPPYINVIVGKADSEVGIPTGLIAMFDADPGTLWSIQSNNGGNFYQKYVRGAAAFSTSPSPTGSTTHSHSNATSGATANNTGKAKGSGTTGTTIAANTHTHTLTASFTASTNNEPQYFNVIYAEKGLPTVSGYAYDDEASTRWTACNGSTTNVSLVVNGVATATTSCDGSTGYYSFTSVTLATNNPVSVFFNATDKGVVTTVVPYSLDITLNPRKGRIWVKTETGITSITNSNLDHCDKDVTGCSNIPYTVTTNNLVTDSGYELHVESSKTYDPGGTVTTDATGGDLHIDDSGTASLDTATSTIGGDVLIDGGATLSIQNTTIIGGGAITTSGTSAILTSTGTPTLTMRGTGSIGGGTTPSLTIYNLVIGDATTATTTLSNSATVTTDVSVGTGSTFNINANLAVQGGDLTTTTTGVVNTTSGTPIVTVSGTGSLGAGSGGSMTFYSLTTGTGTITVTSDITINEDLTIGTGGASTLQVNTNDKTVNTKDFSIVASGIYSASSSSSYPLNVSGSFGNAGTFTHNNGKVVLNGGAGTTQAITGSSDFYDLTATTSSHRTITFAAGTTTGINTNGTLTLTGTSCEALLILKSGTPGAHWHLNRVTPGTGTNSLDYLEVQDSENTGQTLAPTNSVDSGGNTSWTIAASSCEGTSSSSIATGYSFQRKTFYDSTNSRYWMFYYDGSNINIKYSADDGSTWTGITPLNYNTNDFSVWNATISSTSYVWLAVTSGYDILVLEGILSTTNITWDGTIETALNGTSTSDTYAYPTITLDSSNYLWVTARYYDGTNYVVKTVKSDSSRNFPTSTSWSERQVGELNMDYSSWNDSDSDSDGSNLITCAYYGRLYTSSDSGANWTERQPAGDVNKDWYGCASDSDGSNLITAANGGRLYTSTNSGASWTERQPAGDVDKYWNTVASDSDGTNLIAGVGTTGRLYTSSDSGANWTERRPAGDVDAGWKSVASDFDGTNLIASTTTRLYTSSDSGANWTERRPAGDVDKWWFVASDDDGTNLIAGNYGPGRLYTSSDSGANWTERRPAGDLDKPWYNVKSDDDGSNLIVAYISSMPGSGGRLYTSSDSGANWTERQPAGDVDQWWDAVASDDDGSFIMAATSATEGSDGEFFISSDSGANWTDKTPMSYKKDWYAVASDDDASHLIVADRTTGIFSRIYTSSDSGVTWTERQPAGDADKDWLSVASDSDGSNLIAGNNTRLWTSSDSGANWTERRPAGDVDMYWWCVASDSDGSNLIAGNSTRLWTSSDSGVNWTETRPAGDVDEGWSSVASDSDGTNLIVGASYGRLYTSLDSGANWTERQPTTVGDYTWRVASDADGSNLFVSNYSYLFTSSNGGVNWTQRNPEGFVSLDWNSVDSDNDGSFLIASHADIYAPGTESLWISSDSGANWTEQYPGGGTLARQYRDVDCDADGSNLIAGTTFSNLYIYPATGVQVNQLSSNQTNSNVYGILASLGSQDMYAVWIKDTAIEGKKWTNGSGSWDVSATSIGTGKNSLSSNISLSSDTSNSLHLAYIDSSDYVQYKKYSSGSWDGSPTQIIGSASSYTTVSVDTATNNVYVIYLRSSTIYYKLYTSSWGGETDSGLTEGTSPTNLTSNYSSSGKVFLEWTYGSGPYNVNWGMILIPEKIWLFMGLGLLIPKWLRSKKLRKIRNKNNGL